MGQELASLPLTASGKVDRRALPLPAARGPVGYVAPRDPVEDLVAGIFAEVLDVERVGAEDHFFTLGGHSLLAVRGAVAAAREALGVELPLRALFASPTVESLADASKRTARLGESGRTLPPLLRAARPAHLPSPSPSNATGCSTRWSRAARPTTSPSCCAPPRPCRLAWRRGA